MVVGGTSTRKVLVRNRKDFHLAHVYIGGRLRYFKTSNNRRVRRAMRRDVRMGNFYAVYVESYPC